MEQEIFCVPLRSTPKNSRIHPSGPPPTRKGLRPLQPRKEERTACLPPTFLASCAEPPARSRPPPQRPSGTIVVDLAAGLRLSSVRTEGRLVSGSLVLLKPVPRSRRAARAGIASPASQPTPPTTTRGAAPCIPVSTVSPADGSLAAHIKEENFKRSKQTLALWLAEFLAGQHALHAARVLDLTAITAISPASENPRAASWRSDEFLLQWNCDLGSAAVSLCGRAHL